MIILSFGSTNGVHSIIKGLVSKKKVSNAQVNSVKKKDTVITEIGMIKLKLTTCERCLHLVSRGLLTTMSLLKDKKHKLMKEENVKYR